MEIKFIEVRDRATTIPALAISISKADGRLAWRAGFGEFRCIYFLNLAKAEAQYDPWSWNQERLGRTMHVAHLYVTENFEHLKSGQVVDVEYILNETDAPKEPECGGPDAHQTA